MDGKSKINGAVYWDGTTTRRGGLDRINQEFTRLEMLRESARHLIEVARVAFNYRSSYEIDVRFDTLRDAIKAEAEYRQAVHGAVEAIESQFMEELLSI